VAREQRLRPAVVALTVENGGIIDGALGFTGAGGTLVLSSLPTNVISGFAAGDIIDLQTALARRHRGPLAAAAPRSGSLFRQ
jgi:hypothetical protein